MGAFSLGIRQIYGGLKTMFGYGAKAAAKTATKAEKVYHGPSLIDMVKRQPLALPAPSAKQLAADVPQVMVPKVLGGKNLNELRMTQEILADGSHVRYFRGKDSDKILIKMKDHGRLHQEWINSVTEFISNKQKVLMGKKQPVVMYLAQSKKIKQ